MAKVLGALLGLGAISVGAGALQVVALERGELEVWSDPITLAPVGGAPHRELVRATLDAGERVSFEICSEDGLPVERWRGAADIAVWNPDARELVIETPLDDRTLARARRSSRGACLTIASSEALGVSGTYAIEAIFADRPAPAAGLVLRGHITGAAPLSLAHALPVFAAFFFATAFALYAALGRRRPTAHDGGVEPPTLARAAAGVVAMAAAFGLVALVPFGGASVGLGRGAVLAIVEIGLAVGLARTTAALAIGRAATDAPSLRARPIAEIGAALAAGVILYLGGGLLLRLVPATGEAPIETLVAWPSGSLAVALVAVLVPIAEELFFRGLLFGAIERARGTAAALAGSTALFVVAHVPQVWGAWGALASVTLTGLVLGALRAATKSTGVSTVAHLVHNGIVSLGAVAAGLD